MSKQVFVADTILTASAMNTLQGNDYNQTVSTKTASYTLVAADVGTKIVMNSASATTITVNTSLFSAGDTLTILNIAAGVCTVTAGTATVSTTGTLALVQNAGGTLYFTSAGVSVFQADGVAAAASGLVRVGGGTLSGASTTFTNVFSATYNAYKVIVTNAVSGSGNNTFFKLGATVTGYYYAGSYSTYAGAGPTTAAGANQSAWDLQGVAAGTRTMGYRIEIQNPFLSVQTVAEWDYISSDTAGAYGAFGGFLNNTTSYTDLVLGAGVSLSGRADIFGYSLS